MIYTLWLLNDKCNNGQDCQCWFHHPDYPKAFQSTRNAQFAEYSLKQIQKHNPSLQYELRTEVE